MGLSVVASALAVRVAGIGHLLVGISLAAVGHFRPSSGTVPRPSGCTALRLTPWPSFRHAWCS